MAINIIRALRNAAIKFNNNLHNIRLRYYKNWKTHAR